MWEKTFGSSSRTVGVEFFSECHVLLLKLLQVLSQTVNCGAQSFLLPLGAFALGSTAATDKERKSQCQKVLVYSLTFYNDDDGDPWFSWTRLHSDTRVSVTFSQLLLEASSVSGSKRKGRQTHFTELLYTPPSSQWAKWDWFYLLKVWFDSNLQFFQVGGPQLTLQFTEQAKNK